MGNKNKLGLPGGPNEIIVDSRGQWDNPGKNTRIEGNNITMKDVAYPVWAQPNVGPGTMMMPGSEHHFKNAEYVDEYPMMQEGGGVNEEGAEQYKWFKNYLQSPKYVERLKKEFPNYTDKQIQEEVKSRLENIMQTRVGFLPYSSEYSKGPGGVQGFYGDENYPNTMMLRPEYSANTPDDIFKSGNYLNPFKTIPLHEWSHVADNVGNRIPQSTKDFMLSKMKENILGRPKDEYYFTMPTEYLGRMQPLRYLMKQEGLYDAGKQDFTKEDLEKAKQNKTIKNNTHFQDLMKNVKSDEDFIELMNNVASADNMESSANIEYAQRGGGALPKTKVGDTVAYIASQMEANEEDGGRPPASFDSIESLGSFKRYMDDAIKSSMDEDGLCRDNTCVETVKNFYSKAGIEAIPEDVYNNREFLKNYKEYGFEEVDQKNLQPGDVLQYYYNEDSEGIDVNQDLLNFPYHMGVYVNPGEYIGDGDSESPIQRQNMYTGTRKDGTEYKKDPFRAFRLIKQNKNGGSVLPKAQSGLSKILIKARKYFDDAFNPVVRQAVKQVDEVKPFTTNELIQDGWLPTKAVDNVPEKYIKNFDKRTSPIRGGKVFDDGVSEYNSLQSMYNINPERVVRPFGLVTDDAGKAIGYNMENLRKYEDLINWKKTNEVPQSMKDEIINTIKNFNSQGIYHGDLNPNNIMVDAAGNWKIIDPVGFKHSDNMSSEMLKAAKELDLESIKDIQGYKDGGSTSWNWKGKSYSGTLIPSMETKKNRYARTKNGKIKTLPKAQYGLNGKFALPFRDGVRFNYDDQGKVIGESSHIMKSETFDNKNWVSFPTLFQDKDGTWVDMSEQAKIDWKPVYEEAKRRGEVIDFGTDEKGALEFGEGSWKPKAQFGGDLPQAQKGLKNMFTQARKYLDDVLKQGVKQVDEVKPFTTNELIQDGWLPAKPVDNALAVKPFLPSDITARRLAGNQLYNIHNYTAKQLDQLLKESRAFLKNTPNSGYENSVEFTDNVLRKNSKIRTWSTKRS